MLDNPLILACEVCLLCLFNLLSSLWFTSEYGTKNKKFSIIVKKPWFGKISAQPHTIIKQICFPNGNVLFLLLFSLSKNWMHNVVWGCAEILPLILTNFICILIQRFPFKSDFLRKTAFGRWKKFLDYSRHVLSHKCDVSSQNIERTLNSSCDWTESVWRNFWV